MMMMIHPNVSRALFEGKLALGPSSARFMVKCANILMDRSELWTNQHSRKANPCRIPTAYDSTKILQGPTLANKNKLASVNFYCVIEI